MGVDIKTLFEKFVHVGHSTSKWNPKMRGFIHGKDSGMYIFDLEQTADGLDRSKQFIAAQRLKNAKVLFVGTKPQSSYVLDNEVAGTKHFYISKKWSPGLITNFKEIRKRIEHYQTLKHQFETGEINKYTKKEVAAFRKELDKLEKLFSGVAEMRKTPDVLIVLDAIGNRLAIEEARVAGIPVVALVDVNGNPDGIDFVIPGNDDGVESVRFIVQSLLQSM